MRAESPNATNRSLKDTSPTNPGMIQSPRASTRSAAKCIEERAAAQVRSENMLVQRHIGDLSMSLGQQMGGRVIAAAIVIGNNVGAFGCAGITASPAPRAADGNCVVTGNWRWNIVTQTRHRYRAL